MDAVQQFREFVEVAFKESGLRPTTFGTKTAGDPNLLTELRNGREFRRKTREKIERRIRTLLRASEKPKKRAA